MAEKIVCIDGHSILNRAFYGIPELTNSKGLHTNAVYGFMNILLKVLEEEKPQYLAVAFDRREPTFRHEMYEGYKGTRKSMPPELHEQVPLLKELLAACGVPLLELPGYEADDILGTVGRQAEARGLAVTLVSGDRDLLQLATERTCIRIPKTKGGGTVTEMYFAADVKEKYGVTPTEFIDVKALMGDASDNIPGVPGIGEKTATALIASYGSLENLRAHQEEVRPPRAKKALEEHFDLAEMSRRLAAICTEAPVELDFEAARLGNLFTKEAYEVVARLELRSLMKHFDVASFGAAEERPQTSFREVRERAEAERLFAALAQESCVGLTFLEREVENPFAEPPAPKKGKKKPEPLRERCGAALCAAGRGEVVSVLAEGDLTLAFLEEAVNRLAECVPCVAVMNLKSDLKKWNLQESPYYFDAGVASYLLNPLKSAYELDEVARDCLGETVLTGQEADAARILAGAAGPLRERLAESGMDRLFAEVEMPLIFSLDRMEKAGVRVEREALAEYGRNLAGSILSLETEIYELAGRTFNINSPKQLGEILFEDLKLPYGKKTKTGYSTSADVLEKLKPVHPIVGKVLEYRTLAKLKSTYADGLAVFIGSDNRIHGTFNQTITATGRISSTEPNLQNIPIRMELGRAIRKVFVPEAGCLFVDADYSQIELRILAHMSGDEKLIEAYREKQDIHRMTASQVFHIPFDEVTPEQRRNAKAVNFGIVYGISAFGLSEDLSISRKEAAAYIEQYFETYPGVKTYLDGLVEQGKRQGYVTTLFGRRRPIPELKSSNFAQRSFGERVAMNSPIQGTAADIMKIAMIRVDRALAAEGLQARIILQVHDELVIEAPVEEEMKVQEILAREMRGAAELAVPLEIDVNSGYTWFDTK